MKDPQTLTVRNMTKGKLPRLPFAEMKNFALGNDYNLSLVFIGDKRSRKLNREWRGKDKATDILSFSLNKHEGEIFINPRQTKSKAQLFERSFPNYLGFLFIHGLMHLKGFDHSSTMEREEEKVRKEFSI